MLITHNLQRDSNPQAAGHFPKRSFALQKPKQIVIHGEPTISCPADHFRVSTTKCSQFHVHHDYRSENQRCETTDCNQETSDNKCSKDEAEKGEAGISNPTSSWQCQFMGLPGACDIDHESRWIAWTPLSVEGHPSLLDGY